MQICRSRRLTLVRAARLYASAIWVAEDDPRLAWLQLVGALEQWRQIGFPVTTRVRRRSSARVGPNSHHCSKAVPRRLRRKSRDCLYSSRRQAGSYGSSFERSHPPAPEARPEPYDQVDWQDLDAAMRTIYGHRSADLHGGTPIPGPLCSPPRVSRKPTWCRSTLSAASAAASASATPCGPDDLPMHLHVFAAIARGTLLRWWRRDGEVVAPPADRTR